MPRRIRIKKKDPEAHKGHVGDLRVLSVASGVYEVLPDLRDFVVITEVEEESCTVRRIFDGSVFGVAPKDMATPTLAALKHARRAIFGMALTIQDQIDNTTLGDVTEEEDHVGQAVADAGQIWAGIDSAAEGADTTVGMEVWDSGRAAQTMPYHDEITTYTGNGSDNFDMSFAQMHPLRGAGVRGPEERIAPVYVGTSSGRLSSERPAIQQIPVTGLDGSSSLVSTIQAQIDRRVRPTLEEITAALSSPDVAAAICPLPYTVDMLRRVRLRREGAGAGVGDFEDSRSLDSASQDTL